MPVVLEARGAVHDLEIVLGTAMERDPSRRYASADAFADDLQAVLSGRPIAARSPGLLRRAWKAADRHPAAAVAIFVVALLVVALFVVAEARQSAAAPDGTHGDGNGSPTTTPAGEDSGDSR